MDAEKDINSGKVFASMTGRTLSLSKTALNNLPAFFPLRRQFENFFCTLKS